MSADDTNREIEANKYEYLDYTHKLNDYNEIRNLNTYITSATSADYERLSGVSNNLRTRVLKLKQEYLMYEHNTSLYTFRTRILYFVAVCLSILFFVIAMLSEGKIGAILAMILVFTIILSCTLIVVFFVIVNKKRRNYAYDQYYWKEPKLEKVTSSMAQNKELQKSAEKGKDTCTN